MVPAEIDEAEVAAVVEQAVPAAQWADSRYFRRRFGGRLEQEVADHLRGLGHLAPADRAADTVAWVVAEIRSARTADEERARADARLAKERRERDELAAAEAAARARNPSLYREGLKADPAIREAILAHRINQAFHWTPLANLESVLRHGIRPRAYLERHRIPYEAHGYGFARKAYEYREFVAVSLYPQRGMINQASEPVLLVLGYSVIAQEGSFYAPGNTAAARYEFLELARRTGAADLHALFVDETSPTLIDWQSEVWVPGGVDPEFIEKIVVRDEAAATKVDAIQRGLGGRPPLQVEVVRDMNHSGWQGVTIALDLDGDPLAGL